MRRITLIISGLILILAGLVYIRSILPSPVDVETPLTPVPIVSDKDRDEDSVLKDWENLPLTEIVAAGLDTPWAIAFLPEGGILITERKGSVRLVASDGRLLEEPVIFISSVRQVGEGGLHGIALHPDFNQNGYVYLYYTYGGIFETLNRVSRFTFKEGKLDGEEVIVDIIPGAATHNGGRIKFGPDGYLYITTGDAQDPSLSQDRNSLAGKILRVTDGGDPAPGNPFANRIYSYGHRNPQGITWDGQGRLWSTEHGAVATDELNLIEPGENYGWPTIRGDETAPGLRSPVIQSGRDTWAPSGLAYLSESLFFGGLRGQALYQVVNLSEDPELLTHFKGELGRIREVIAGPDGMLYISTSNRDGRGRPQADDDKIIRINPYKL